MKKFDNFCLALENLKDIYEYEEPYSNVVLTGMTALYEICFEQSWKAMKEILEVNGFDESATGSPRKVLKTAYKAGMIKDEKMWLDALVSRNNVAHAYNKDVALEIVEDTRTKYYRMFRELEEEVRGEWMF